MCALAYSIDCRARSLSSITIDGITRRIYLFVEGSYVGEAYCPALMGRRVSEWEATAQRKNDFHRAKAAASASQEVRARIQEEIETAKQRRRRLTREQEYSRQREEIHPPHVLDQLAQMTPPAPSSLRLEDGQT